MKTHRNLQRSLLVLAASLAALPALASDDCEVPMHRWQSREAVMQMAARQGWDVSRLKIDDGCYEVRGRDAEGREFKAKLDPGTLAVVKLKQRKAKHDRDRDRDRSRDRKSGANGAAPSGAAAPANPLIRPGGSVSGRID